jgi:ribosomal protein S18 acetylase RimI-like enzyme
MSDEWPAPALSFREATRDDVPRIVQMLADDVLGRSRERYETPLPEAYYDAFDAIARVPNNELIVAVFDGGVAGVLQLTFIPYLTHQGGWRAVIEGVRIASERRGQGIGRELIRRAVERAAARRCRLVQLTTDKTRRDAVRFYESLGFEATHEGMKLRLEL